MRLAWLTDIHLNLVSADRWWDLMDSVKHGADIVAISGDIAESPTVSECLAKIARVIKKPIYFVLGNHDFYRGSVASTRKQITRIAQDSQYLHYLTAMQSVELTPKTALIGHDGWADTNFGDYRRSDVILGDHQLIAELAPWFDGARIDKSNLRRAMTSLAAAAARHFKVVLEEAASKHSNVIAVTHIPPFQEAALYRRQPSDDHFLPYFACRIVGDVMRSIMQQHPNSNLLVLCGHTHSQAEVQVLDNLRVLTGAAEYGRPRICQILDVE